MAAGRLPSGVSSIPAYIDATFWNSLQLDHAKLLKNAIVWATNEPAPAVVEGQGMIDMTTRQQKDSITVHLVNLTNAMMMMKGPARKINPVTKLRVRIRLPADKKIARTKLLVAGTGVPHRMEVGTAIVEVPSVAVHEVVAFVPI